MISLYCLLFFFSFLFFFFFQAEDGIRDTSVTGVQTCALPISLHMQSSSFSIPAFRLTRRVSPGKHSACISPVKRSEERRVGKSVDLGGGRIIKKKKKT